MISKASEVDRFPYNSKHNCYLMIDEDGKLEQINYGKSEIEKMYLVAKQEKKDIFIVWPGQYRSDLFIVDDLNAFADAFGIERNDSHKHRISWSLANSDDGKSQYATVQVEFKCGCKIDLNNIRKIALDFDRQFGWDVAKTTGFGSGTRNGKTIYSLSVRRKSIILANNSIEE